MVALARWVGRALCANVDTELFFPDRYDGMNTAVARQVCESCPVKRICAEWAIGEFIMYGVFGGTTPVEREAIRRERGIVMPRMVRDLMPHGTLAATRRHQRRGETLCDKCHIVLHEHNRTRMRKYNARRRPREASA